MINGSAITDPMESADHFDKHFCNIAKEIESKLFINDFI